MTTVQYGWGSGSDKYSCCVVTAADVVMAYHRNRDISIDTGMVVVIFISMMYIGLVFILLFYVKNEWCDLLFNNMTVSNKIILHSFNLIDESKFSLVVKLYHVAECLVLKVVRGLEKGS